MACTSATPAPRGISPSRQNPATSTPRWVPQTAGWTGVPATRDSQAGASTLPTTTGSATGPASTGPGYECCVDPRTRHADADDHDQSQFVYLTLVYLTEEVRHAPLASPLPSHGRRVRSRP